MSIIAHAKREFALLNSDDEYTKMIEDCVIEVIEKVANQGHSGSSIGIFKNFLNTLLSYKPLTTLTGEDDEWMCGYGGGIYGVSECKNQYCV